MTDYKEALYKIVGERIKSHRDSRKISQLELSKRLDISRSSISNIEVGRHQIPLHALYELSKEFKLDISDLLPPYDEIVSFATSDITDYSSYLNSSKFEEKQKETISDVLKNI